MELTAHLLICAASLGAPTKHDLAPLQTEVRRLVDGSIGNPAPGLALTVIQGGQVVWFEGFGVADRATEEAITEDTVFAIASISKTVAAWGHMRLVESEAITLDEPVLEHLEGWAPRRRRDEADGITLRRLLSHTAGLSVHGVEGVAYGEPLPKLLDAILGKAPGQQRVELVQSPGEGFRYSGGGTSIAQLLFEQLTERDFCRAMHEDVVAPLGMRSSGFGWNAERVAASATPYMPSGKETARLDYAQAGTASFVTTSRDFARFAIACMPDHRPESCEAILSRASLLEMLEHSPDSPNTGLGFFHGSIEGLSTVGHTGGDHGWTAALRMVSDSGDAILVLQNCYAAEPLSLEIEALWARWIRGNLQDR